jgi:hypothetical protein
MNASLHQGPLKYLDRGLPWGLCCAQPGVPGGPRMAAASPRLAQGQPEAGNLLGREVRMAGNRLRNRPGSPGEGVEGSADGSRPPWRLFSTTKLECALKSMSFCLRVLFEDLFCAGRDSRLRRRVRGAGPAGRGGGPHLLTGVASLRGIMRLEWRSGACDGFEGGRSYPERVPGPGLRRPVLGVRRFSVAPKEWDRG